MGYNMRGRGKRKEMTGVVLNNSMDKTVKMLVERLARHKKYKKYIKYRAKYLVHDPHNRCQIGDKVRIKTWEEMEKEFGLTKGKNINSKRYYFVKSWEKEEFACTNSSVNDKLLFK